MLPSDQQGLVYGPVHSDEGEESVLSADRIEPAGGDSSSGKPPHGCDEWFMGRVALDAVPGL